MQRPTGEKPDLREKSRTADGQTQYSDRRLFMQLLAFGGCSDPAPLVEVLKQTQTPAVLYADVNDPHGVGLLTFHEQPDHFVTDVRDMLNRDPFASLAFKPQYTMLGRTYSTGFEPDLVEWLIEKPKRTALNSNWPWAVWYPLRRSGAFAQLPPERQREILMEHGTVGRSYGEADYVHDIRLTCHGLDGNDNDFVIGLVGKELYPLSAIVGAMRKTTQTSQYLERLGPFFVGKTLWQNG